MTPVIAPPEPGLTEAELVRRAVALQPVLIERQAEAERLTRCPEATHDDYYGPGSTGFSSHAVTAGTSSGCPCSTA